jgi:PAS domain S-box-containing protein
MLLGQVVDNHPRRTIVVSAMGVKESGVRLKLASFRTSGAPSVGAARFFDLSVDMLCLVGVDGYFKQLNRNWTQILGYSNKELQSRPYIEFVHPDDRDATLAEAAKLALGHEAIHFRNRYRCKDGSFRWLAWTATGAMDTGVIYASARDVTDEVVADEEELVRVKRRLQRLRDTMQKRAFSMVFQPIVDFRTRELLGLEALARFKAPPRRPPDHWFAEADALGLRPELEMLAIEEAVTYMDRLPEGAFMSVNISPETLLTKDFSGIIATVDAERLVVEVTEHAAVSDYTQLNQAVSKLRERGVRLAIDDAGAGFSSLKHIVRLVPEFIKLDMFLTRDINSDPVKRALAAAMVSFAAEIGSGLVAEGVETARELDALGDLGVEEAQGFFLSKPLKSPSFSY